MFTTHIFILAQNNKIKELRLVEKMALPIENIKFYRQTDKTKKFTKKIDSCKNQVNIFLINKNGSTWKIRKKKIKPIPRT